MLDLKGLATAVALSAALAASAAAPAAAGNYAGDFMIRAGVTVVHPDAGGSVTDQLGLVSGGVGVIPGSDADVSTEVIPSLTLTYFLTKNVAAELFCCFAKHQAEAAGSIAGLGEVADFWIFPPAVTLQYHFDNMGAFKPYIGAGVQYIHFFNEESAYGSVDIDDAFGFTLQAGLDVEIGGGWYLNADVKKTWIDTEVNWSSVGLKGDVDVDPWIFTVGVGYRFDLFGPRVAAAPLK